jgi:uncharacterized cupredoxin-like copper-binding protein
MSGTSSSETVSIVRPALAILAVGGLLAACSAAEPQSPGTETPRTIEVRMTDEFRFAPDHYSVTAGETVRFRLINDGALVHEFLIGDEQAQADFAEEMAGGGMHHATDAGLSVDPGQTAEFEYTFSEAKDDLLAGCHEPGHYEAGMVATISVADAEGASGGAG